MQIELPDDFKDDANQFFVKCGINPTEYQIHNFVLACLALGFDAIIESHDMVWDIIKHPQTVGKPSIPPGGICPECQKKIIIGQDLKRKCNCKVW